jgi:LDH2 family malate/lactate/ureidoglycolate dehydrogenase
MTYISQQDCEALCVDIFTGYGMADGDARLCAEHLIYNELCGKTSHGLVRVKWIVNGLVNRGHGLNAPSYALDNGSISIIDGKNHIGIIAAHHAAKMGIDKARAHGISFTGARNYHTTTGSMNYYAQMILKAGMIGIIGCNSTALVTHPDAHDPVIGTNPICFAIPARGTALVADVTTAAMAYGKIMVLKQKGEDLPLGVIVDAEGKPSTNPNDANDGAMLPLEGFKGFGLGMAIEMMAGALIGAKTGKDAVQGSDGIFVIIIDPSKFENGDNIIDKNQRFIDEIKASKNNGNVQEILIPGERSTAHYDANTRQDTFEILDQTYQDMQTLLKDASC